MEFHYEKRWKVRQVSSREAVKALNKLSAKGWRISATPLNATRILIVASRDVRVRDL